MKTIAENTQVQTKDSQAALTPQGALQMLKAGNRRFLGKGMWNRNLINQVQQTATGQYPFAAILGCIDSRVPAELIFDVGIGDIFNVRVAGNFANTDILGSLEFACKVAGSKVILVLGHTGCGAVKGACDQVELGNLTSMLENIRPSVEAVDDETADRTSNNPEFVQKVADHNVRRTLSLIKERSSVLSEMIDSGEIVLVGAMYDVASGEVNFWD